MQILFLLYFHVNPDSTLGRSPIHPGPPSERPSPWPPARAPGTGFGLADPSPTAGGFALGYMAPNMDLKTSEKGSWQL